nr:hypothetical protein [uncultured Microbulbifer sp.]
MSSANDGINFTVANPTLRICLHRALIDTYPIPDLAAIVFTIASLVILSTVPPEVYEQFATPRLVGPHMLIDALMAQQYQVCSLSSQPEICSRLYFSASLSSTKLTSSGVSFVTFLASLRRQSANLWACLC